MTENEVANVLQTYQSHTPTTALYFAPLLPWQRAPWQQVTGNMDRMAHGMLFAGMKGIGKHAFVWRLTAWMLCDNTGNDNDSHADHAEKADVACGSCQSCLWLKAGTHPHLMTLPTSRALVVEETLVPDNSHSKRKAKGSKKKKSTGKNSNNANVANSDEVKVDKIKIEDIRNLTPFVNQSSHGLRICIIDYADTMTLAAANALLKTLEEPHTGVHLFLISDAPANLLATVKSRVQKAPIDAVNPQQAQAFLQQVIAVEANHSQQTSIEQVNQLLSLASGAPLAALALITQPWYDKRKLWLTTWLALRSNKRSSTAASDYWQQQLTLSAFVHLSEVMLMDLKRIHLGLPAKQHDLGFDRLDSIEQISFEDMQQVTDVITDIKQAVYQNVQEKLGYDKLMAQLAQM